MKQSDRRIVCDNCGTVHILEVTDREDPVYQFQCSRCKNRTSTMKPIELKEEVGELAAADAVAAEAEAAEAKPQ